VFIDRKRGMFEISSGFVKALKFDEAKEFSMPTSKKRAVTTVQVENPEETQNVVIID